MNQDDPSTAPARIPLAVICPHAQAEPPAANVVDGEQKPAPVYGNVKKPKNARNTNLEGKRYRRTRAQMEKVTKRVLAIALWHPDIRPSEIAAQMGRTRICASTVSEILRKARERGEPIPVRKRGPIPAPAKRFRENRPLTAEEQALKELMGGTLPYHAFKKDLE